jgi:hypothetical protein
MNPAPVSLFPIDSKPYGISYGGWTVKWWQWLLSIPKPDNPVLDNTGNKAAINQYDKNVFFLCQTLDTAKLSASAKPVRNVPVRAGTSILMPVINWVSVLHEDGESEQELASAATARMNVVSRLELTINGVEIKKGLERYRVRSPLFDMVLPEDNVLELPSGFRYFLSDGYWLFFVSVEENTKISTFGSCSSGVNRFLVDYNISTLQ